MNLPASILTIILQRTPAPRVVAFLGEILAASPISSFLKTAVVLEGSLGAMHALAGATSITASTPSPLSATVGVAVASPGVVFGVVGTQAPPSSWSIDAIPPGMSFSEHSAPGTYNVVTPYATLDGTPNAVGIYTLHLIAYEYNTGTGLATPTFIYTVNVSGAPPVFTTQPASQTVNAGANVTLTAAAGATSYQWQFNGTNISGATNSTLTLSNIGTTQRGSYTLVASNPYGSTASNAASVAVAVNSYLYNISTLGYVGSGPNQNLDAGFYTTGSGNKNIVVRGIGPNLAVVQPKFAGLVLTNPELVLNSASAQLTINTAWGGGQSLVNAFATVYAAPFQSNSNDTAIYTSVPAGPGIGYTAVLTSTNSGTGVAQIEAYDYDSYVGTPASHLINISTRGYVGTGAGTGASQYQFLDAGFWTIGSTSQTVLIRAVGPGEAANFPGQNLAKPSLVLYDSSGNVIASNAGWGNAVAAGNSTVAAGIQPATTAIMNSVYASTIAPGSNDCAMVVTLPANAGYTAEVTSADSASTGIALVEVYNLP